jgi:hypothetical protein
MESQCNQIKAHLQSGRSITPLEALYMFGTFRLGARIYNLKQQGLKIKTKAQELRIGNYLQDFGGNIAQVIHLTKDKTILESPIALTEEWLLKFGFNQASLDEEGELQYFKRGGLTLFSINKKMSFEVFKIYDYDIYMNHPKYVHQLQNLYFALNGTELTLQK